MASESISIPRNKRWSAVSASANADMAYQKFLKETPDAYEYVCVCKRPGGEDDEEEESEDEEEKSENEENQPIKCDGGQTCLCRKPAADHPDHPWTFTKAAMDKLTTYRIMVDLRNPDSFFMYTFNDHSGYGAIEVAQNLLLDFQEASGNWKEQWAVCETLALLLVGNWLAPMAMVDDGDLFQETEILLEHMFLTMLAELERQDSLGPNSNVRNLGLMMGFYASNASEVRSAGYINTDTDSKANTYQGRNFVPYLLGYARKHNTAMHGPPDIDEIIAEGEEEAEDNDVKLPTAKKDPWKWATAFKTYERKNQAASHGGHRKTHIGGDSLDITTFSSQERKAASFTKKDPLTADMIKAIKEGLVLQLA